MSQRFSNKILHVCIIISIIIIIAFVGLISVLNYQENGEKNMPFNISKISLISSISAEDIADSENRWNKNINQDNDLYIYIEKNENYNKVQTIKNICINNFKIQTPSVVGTMKIYKPSDYSNAITEDKEENEASEILVTGEKITDIKKLRVSNQGGIITFRIANKTIGNYKSNDDENLEYNNLLNKMNLKNEDLKADVTFDLSIELNSGRKYKAENIKITVPYGDIVTNGTTSVDNIVNNDIIFKRIEN